MLIVFGALAMEGLSYFGLKLTNRGISRDENGERIGFARWVVAHLRYNLDLQLSQVDLYDILF